MVAIHECQPKTATEYNLKSENNERKLLQFVLGSMFRLQTGEYNETKGAYLNQRQRAEEEQTYLPS